VATVHVERATSEMAVFDGELPLSERQLERLAEQVAVRIEKRKRSKRDWASERKLASNTVLSDCGCGG
jgi:hypothetical protein